MKPSDLVEMYRSMSEESRNEEIDAMFQIVWAILEAVECDSLETYPNPNIKLKISCEVMKDESGKYFN